MPHVRVPAYLGARALRIPWKDLHMKKRLWTLLAVPALLLAGVAFASPAYADSPHFVRASAALSGQDLVVSWKEAGLGANQLIDYVASASASATFVCVNKGGG